MQKLTYQSASVIQRSIVPCGLTELLDTSWWRRSAHFPLNLTSLVYS